MYVHMETYRHTYIWYIYLYLIYTFDTIANWRYNTHKNHRLCDVFTNMAALRDNNGHVHIWTNPDGRKYDCGDSESWDQIVM